MNKKLYNLMDWAAVEEIVYGESNHPEKILGSSIKGNNTLVQCFYPGALKVTLCVKNKSEVTEYKMEQADEEGFFAVLIPGKDKIEYTYKVEFSGKKKVTKEYPEIYKTMKKVPLGATISKLDGISGCYFSVYAPDALRVSIIGSFNNDERFLQMIKDDNTGVYTLFVPGVNYKDEYHYSILAKGNTKLYRLDPYSRAYNDNYDMSVISKPDSYKWNDDEYIKSRNSTKISDKPLNIYEICLSAIYRDEDNNSPAKTAEKLSKYLLKTGYTHVELMPVFESLNELSAGCDACSYLAVAKKYSIKNELAKFVDIMHKAGIGVIVQLPFASFAKSKISFNNFDGEPLYEYDNAARLIDPATGRLFFNYSKPEVVDLLKSSVDMLINEYHIDGFKLLDMASMLYLDYHKESFEPNINGENIHLEAIEFIKHINKYIHGKKSGLFTIAEDLSSFPKDTVLNTDSLGFDFTVNYGLHNDSLRYITLDPIERKNHHELITRSAEYLSKENYINTISHYDVDGFKGGLISKMPGDIPLKFANLKAFMGYLYTMPGKKSIFMGQEIAQFDSFNALKPVQFDLLMYNTHEEYSRYVKDLNNLYLKDEIFNNEKDIAKTFSFVNDTSSETNVLSYIRKSGKSFKLIVINFANKAYEKYKIGAPEKGKYTLGFSSDMEIYGGSTKESVTYRSRLDAADGFDSSIRISLAPLSINIFDFAAYTDAELKEMARKKAAREKKISDRIKANEKFLKDKIAIRKDLKAEYDKRLKEALSKIQ